MSIQSEITRLSGNVSDALDAIEAKGVTIPTGANSDDLANLIGQISGGGGGSITQDENGYLVLSPDGGGGGGATIPWFGIGNATLLHTSNYEMALSNTNYSSLTPATTQQALTLPATTYSSYPSTQVKYDEFQTNIDLDENGLVLVTDTMCEHKYLTTESEMGVAHVLTHIATNVTIYGRNAGVTSGVPFLTTSTTYNNSYIQLFTARNNSGELTGAGGTYGIYMMGYTPLPTLTVSGSVITKLGYNITAYIRSSDSYMSVSAFSNIDTTNTKLKVRVKTYSVDYPGTKTGVSERAVNMLNNATFPTD